jgi:hypothetical protein
MPVATRHSLAAGRPTRRAQRVQHRASTGDTTTQRSSTSPAPSSTARHHDARYSRGPTRATAHPSPEPPHGATPIIRHRASRSTSNPHAQIARLTVTHAALADDTERDALELEITPRDRQPAAHRTVGHAARLRPHLTPCRQAASELHPVSVARPVHPESPRGLACPVTHVHNSGADATRPIRYQSKCAAG